MKKNTKKSLDTYNQTAETLADIYNNLKRSDVLPGLAERLPCAKGKDLWALESACGTGRDAKWLAKKGFNVVAFDGASEMIRLAKKKQGHKNIQYYVDLMPDIRKIRALGRSFDVILLSAVWMHLDKEDRKKMFQTLCDVANDNALVYISLRQGPSPEGRPMYDVTADELEILAKKAGKDFELVGVLDDKQGREAVNWQYVALRM